MEDEEYMHRRFKVATKFSGLGLVWGYGHGTSSIVRRDSGTMYSIQDSITERRKETFDFIIVEYIRIVH